MLLGQFQPSLFFRYSCIIISTSLFAIYYISQYYQHVKPFPDTSISDCAGHYPEYIIFRLSTIAVPVLIILGWLTNNFYLNTIGREKVFRMKKFHPQIPTIMGIMGALLLMGSTANIDTGKRNGTWHQRCAAGFFLFTFLSHVFNLGTYWLVYRSIKGVNYANLLFKTFIIALQILQVYEASSSGLLSQQFFDGTFTKGNKGNFIEWTMAFTYMLYLYAMSLDVSQFKFVYEYNKNQQEILEIQGEVN